MEQTPDKRAGDAERSHALDRLGQYFADGYLDINEFDERTGRAAVARTQGELDALFIDLPEPQGPQDPQGLHDPQISAAAVPRAEISAQRELDEVLKRGRKLQRVDGAIWAVVLILFFLGTFVFSVGFSWVLFPLGAFASWGARSVLDVGDEEEELIEELRSKEREERAERLRRAAERRRELGQ